MSSCVALTYTDVGILCKNKKVICNMAFHYVGQKNSKMHVFSQYPEAGITMCFLLHVKLGDIIADSSSLSEY